MSTGCKIQFGGQFVDKPPIAKTQPLTNQVVESQFCDPGEAGVYRCN